MSEFFFNLQNRVFGREMVHLLRPLMVIGVLLGSYYLGRNGSMRQLVLLIVAGLAIIFMRYPMVALVVLVFASFFVRLEIGTGTGSAINVSMILIIILMVLWILDMLVQQKRIWLYGSRVLPPLVAFSLTAILAFITGQLPWFSFARQVSLFAQLGGLALFLLSAGAFLWIGQYATDVKWLKIVTWLYVGIGCVFIFFHFIVIGKWIPGFNNIPVFIRESTGSLLWTWLVALSASQALLNRQLKVRWRILLAMTTMLTLLAGWQNRQWASGWIPAVIALLVILLMVEWRVGVFVGVLMVLAVLVLNPPFTDPALTSDQYSFMTRTEAWKIVLGDIWRVNPLLGLGPANYYNYTPLFSLIGYNVRFNSHNQYVDMLAQNGILGLATFLWLAFEIGWLAWRLKDRASPGFNRAYVIGVLGGLMGTLAAGMFGDWLIPFVYNIGMDGFRTSMFAWLFLGGLVVIERMTEAQTKQASPHLEDDTDLSTGKPREDFQAINNGKSVIG